MTPADVQHYLHTYIPLSAAMQVAVDEAAPGGVVLRAPLAPNINHRETGFGGSASALAILSAWTLLHVRLRAGGFDGRIVIQRNEMAYIRPITSAFVATCPAPPAAAWEAFTDALERRGKGRIALAATLACDAEEVGRFAGTYVALSGPGR